MINVNIMREIVTYLITDLRAKTIKEMTNMKIDKLKLDIKTIKKKILSNTR